MRMFCLADFAFIYTLFFDNSLVSGQKVSEDLLLNARHIFTEFCVPTLEAMRLLTL